MQRSSIHSSTHFSYISTRVTLHSLISQAFGTDSKSDKVLKTMHNPHNILFLFIQSIYQMCFLKGNSVFSVCLPKGKWTMLC